MSDYLTLVQDQYPLIVIFIGGLFGAVVGSFLNVVVYRLPLMLERDWNTQASEILGQQAPDADEPFNLVFPNSHCPACDHSIKPWENIPVISYVFLRGRCSNCNVSISARYPIVELATAIITAAVCYRFGLNVTSVACAVLTWALITLSLIDYDHQLLPDDITLPLLWLGLIAGYFNLLVGLDDALWGAVIGYMSLWSVYQLFKLITGKEGMGYGDFKLLAMLGAWLGWQSLPVVIILSSFAGALVGGCLIVFGRDRTLPIPFGPYLAIAGWIALMWGDQLTSSYLQFMAF